MSKEFKIYEYEVVYLSYDEPNAQANWEDLLKKVPYARHVHGIKGSDAAHKEIAKHTNTKRVTVIDGDVTIDELYLQQILEVDDSIDTDNTVFSWPSKNSINGLLYGNGGIKCWPVKAMLEMKTHEAAEPNDPSAQVDFCWALNYMAIDKCYSTIRNNDSKLQAWRAGFREGVKMVLEGGNKVDDLSMLNIGNLNRLRIWMTVGLDVENGIWAILGARQACHLVQFTDWDYTNVRDFDYLNEYFDKNVKNLSEIAALEQCKTLGSIISTQTQLCDPLSIEESKFFKSIEFNPDRQLKTIHSIDTINEYEYDIVMVTYNELNAEENWNNLKSRFPRAKRIDGVKGIHNAHVAAAKLARTKMFWVVDGDAVIHKNFNFDYIVHPNKMDHVHVWRSKNPINDLEYGFGGIKLFPREMTINMDMSKPDMTTSISTKYKPVFEVSNTTSFNTDEFSAWRSGFRECCKLSSKVIDRQNDKETIERLETWCTIGLDRPYGKYAIEGAISGREYGEANIGNLEALKKINDFEWLKNKFEWQYNNSTVEILNGLELLYPENTTVAQLKRTLYQFPFSEKGLVDAYSIGQIKSKLWLIENLPDNLGLVFICAGWYGTLASFMFEHCRNKFIKIRSFDIDPSCASVADSINKLWVIDGWKFKASTLDIHDMRYPTEYTTVRSNGTNQTLVEMPDTIINTSCEHIENFEVWYSTIPNGKIVVLQTNNYVELKEHINCSTSLAEFAKQTPMSSVFYEGELFLKDYTRYMRIGIK